MKWKIDVGTILDCFLLGPGCLLFTPFMIMFVPFFCLALGGAIDGYQEFTKAVEAAQ